MTAWLNLHLYLRWFNKLSLEHTFFICITLYSSAAHKMRWTKVTARSQKGTVKTVEITMKWNRIAKREVAVILNRKPVITLLNRRTFFYCVLSCTRICAHLLVPTLMHAPTVPLPKLGEEKMSVRYKFLLSFCSHSECCEHDYACFQNTIPIFVLPF